MISKVLLAWWRIALTRCWRNVVKALSLVAQLDETLLTTDYKFIVSGPVTALEIHTALEEFIPLYPGVRVRRDCKDDILIHTDLRLLRRIVDNCISNSFRAGKATWVLLACECDKDVLHIEVKDNGCGMTKYQLDRIGLGFSTTGSGGNGTKILIDLLVRAHA